VSISGLGIDSSRIESMLAQLKAHATNPNNRVVESSGATPSTTVNFSDALKSQLDQVAQAQNKAKDMGQAFSAGDDRVSLSDVMISSQKAGIAFQATVQVRNKMVSAYQEMMNMQV
jgi:flagellar hook-basal body complex protein FliE